MGEVTSAIHARLVADANLGALLSAYGGAPAVFSGKYVPEDAALPYVFIGPPIADNPFDAKNQLGHECYRDIHCWAADTGSLAAVEAVAKRVRDLCHRHDFAVGSAVITASASGPVGGPDSDGAVGMIVTLKLVYMED